MLKYCLGCDTKKEMDECFAKHTAKKDGHQTYCRACKKRMDAKHHQENKAAQQERNRQWRNKRRKWFEDFKSQHGCAICPENDPCCLDFHHPRDDKEFNISKHVTNLSIDELVIEMNKCVLVCANCHRKLHKGKIKLPAHGAGVEPAVGLAPLLINSLAACQ